MKVLMFAPGNSPHSVRPLTHLLDQGCEVIFADKVNPFPGERKGYTFVKHFLGRKRLHQYFGLTIGNWLAYWAYHWPLKRMKNEFEPDITHVHWVDGIALSCLKAGLNPLVLSVWGSDINECFLPGACLAHCKVIGQALAGADRVIIDSKEIAHKCCQLAGSELPAELLNLGVDTNLFHPGYTAERARWRQKLGIPENGKVLLSNRLLAPLYRHDLILEAFAQARPRLPVDTYLVFNKFVVSSRDYLKGLESQVENSGLSQWVRWIDGVPSRELPGLYAFVDIILNFPERDTFPVSFLEAAACEKRVVTCSLPSYTADDFAGRFFQVVKTDQVPDLAEAMVKEVNCENPLTPQLSKARSVVINEFEESVYKRRLVEIYQSILTSNIN